MGIAILLLPLEWPARYAGLGLVLGLWLLLTAYGAYQIRLNWFVRSVHSVPGSSIALTFDDGPDPETTPVVLSVLREHRVPATFFLIGQKAAQHPDLVRRIVSEGHAIGNHSDSHSRRIGFFSTRHLHDDLARCNLTLEKITGSAVRLFRPPFGVTNPRYARVLTSLDMISVGWSLRSYDTVAADDNVLLRRLKKKLRGGQIVLLHDTVRVTAEVLPAFLAYCKARGLAFTKLG